MMLVNIKSIQETATPGTLILQIVADIGSGHSEEMPFTYSPTDNVGLTSQVKAWLDAHPDFPREPYVPFIDPSPILTKRQIVRALIIGAGQTDPDAFMETGIAAIPDAATRALALADWRHAPTYSRDHELFSNEDILAAIEKTPEQIDELWDLGSQQPA